MSALIGLLVLQWRQRQNPGRKLWVALRDISELMGVTKTSISYCQAAINGARAHRVAYGIPRAVLLSETSRPARRLERVHEGFGGLQRRRCFAQTVANGVAF